MVCVLLCIVILMTRYLKEIWKCYIFFLNKVKLKSLCRYAEELVPILWEAKRKKKILIWIWYIFTHQEKKKVEKKDRKATWQE